MRLERHRRGNQAATETRISILQQEEPVYSTTPLFHNVAAVETDYDLSLAICKELADAISRFSSRNVYHAFLSETEGVEMALFNYLDLGWRVGKSIDGMLTHKLVLPVRTIARKVGSEAHRMKGFVRLMLVKEGFYYARLKPDYHILPLIAPHFADRFSDQHWIIHDTRQGRGIIHDAARKQWVIAELDLLENPDFTAGERFYRELWKKYFTRLAVEERLNPELQRRNLPLKYRRFLVEME
jgi:probable DNA metabolism protein